MQMIDYFEGVPNYFYRKLINVIYEGNELEAFIYFKTESDTFQYESDLPIPVWTREMEMCGLALQEYHKRYLELCQQINPSKFGTNNN